MTNLNVVTVKTTEQNTLIINPNEGNNTMNNQATTLNTNLTEENTMTELEMKRAEMKAQIEAKLQAAREKAEMDLLMNSKFQDALVQQALREDATTKLKELYEQCSAIIATVEVYNKVLKKVRTWNPSKRFGYGNQFADLFGLLTGVQYSVQEHKELLLSATGLSADLIERTITATGTLPYYSPTHNVLVEGTPTNVDELITCVQLLEHALGITIDKSLLTQANADRQFEVAQVRAEGAKAEAETAINLEFSIIR